MCPIWASLGAKNRKLYLAWVILPKHLQYENNEVKMERRFNLIKSDFEKHEKRVLPRFPFCYLTFKSQDHSKVYEVKDISFTGMQVALKDPEEGFKPESGLRGTIHWLGRSLDIAGTVKWNTAQRVGIEFLKKNEVLESVQRFLDLNELVKNLKSLHKMSEGLDIPARLKYWLRSDGPVELFIWQHNDGEVAKVQILLLENFVEWEDGVGLKTGRILSKRNVDSPLISEDEWVFHIDHNQDQEKIQRAKELIMALRADQLLEEVRSFVLRQLT